MATQKAFVLYKDTAGEWRWRLFATNGKTIADSGEGYKNKADCLHGAKLVASTATGAPVFNQEAQTWEQ